MKRAKRSVVVRIGKTFRSGLLVAFGKAVSNTGSVPQLGIELTDLKIKTEQILLLCYALF